MQNSFALGKHIAVFQVEARVILSLANTDEATGTEQNICSTRTRNTLVQECAVTLEVLAETKEVNPIWVLEVHGNEKLNELAR